jgi:uncharacterized protein YqjF (DUF2071 family)
MPMKDGNKTREETTSLFQAEWRDVLAMHFRVRQRTLDVAPFEADLFCEAAYISVFAFRMCHTRPTGTGALGERVVATAIPEPSLNIRTYVRYKTRPGILFLAEWMPNELGVALARSASGLPYCNGQIELHHDSPSGIHGRVVDAESGRAFSYEASVASSPAPRRAETGSLEEFLMERYQTFTHQNGLIREIRVEHPPWQFQRAQSKLLETDLLRVPGPWMDEAMPVAAHFSPGAMPVGLELPQVIENASC